MPYRHRTHLNVLRQGPRHLPDNNKSLHKSTTHHSSAAENAIFQQNRCCSKSKRSTTDPKTQMRCRPTLQDTTNPYDLRRDTQLKLSHPTPTDRDRRCQLAKRVSAFIHRDALRTPLTRNSRFPLHCPEETH